MEPIENTSQSEKPKTIEESAREALTKIYVLGEEFLLDSTLRQQGVRSKHAKTLSTDPAFNEDIKRLQYEVGTEAGKFRAKELELGEEIILMFIPDEEERHSIKEEAIKVTKDFWAKKLEEPDLPADVVMLGRRRITQITQKLEDFTKPSENS